MSATPAPEPRRPIATLNVSAVDLEIGSANLDQVRGVLFALSNRGTAFFESVSTLAIRNALARRGRDGLPATLLEELHSVRDIQRLRHGRWVPCVTGLVAMGEIFVVLSGMPTPMVERALGTTPFGSGSSRLIRAAPSDIGAVSHQFSWWCRAPESTVDWTQNIVRGATFRLGIMPKLEYFNHWDRSVTHRWVYALPRSVPRQTIALAREKGPIGTVYYLCRIEDATVEGVEELPGDWNDAFRLGFGLRVLCGNSSFYSARFTEAQTCEILTPKYLPSEESMVLRALGVVQHLPNSSLVSSTLPMGAWPRVEMMLQSLGLSKGLGTS
jgi:hypothetical protein